MSLADRAKSSSGSKCYCCLAFFYRGASAETRYWTVLVALKICSIAPSSINGGRSGKLVLLRHHSILTNIGGRSCARFLFDPFFSFGVCLAYFKNHLACSSFVGNRSRLWRCCLLFTGACGGKSSNGSNPGCSGWRIDLWLAPGQDTSCSAASIANQPRRVVELWPNPWPRRQGAIENRNLHWHGGARNWWLGI